MRLDIPVAGEPGAVMLVLPLCCPQLTAVGVSRAVPTTHTESRERLGKHPSKVKIRCDIEARGEAWMELFDSEVFSFSLPVMTGLSSVFSGHEPGGEHFLQLAMVLGAAPGFSSRPRD